MPDADTCNAASASCLFGLRGPWFNVDTAVLHHWLLQMLSTRPSPTTSARQRRRSAPPPGGCEQIGGREKAVEQRGATLARLLVN
eukprot:3936574-Rhodomonas_salina.1